MLKDLTILKMHCFACLKDDHIIRDCPHIHFVVDLITFFRVKAKY